MAGDDGEKDSRRGRRWWVRRLLVAVSALVSVAGGFVILLAPDGSIHRATRWEEAQRRDQSRHFVRGRRLEESGDAKDNEIHVCLTSDDTDLRGLVVTIRSAVASAREPGRFHFHVVTLETLVSLFKEALKTHLPGVRVSVRHNAQLQRRIQSFISFRETSRARRELVTPLNFAPFYLHEFLVSKKNGKVPAERIIYLDPDTVVLGDLAELHAMDLQGHAIGAVKTCSQRLEDYVDLEALTGLGFSQYSPSDCIPQRAVFVYDVQHWVQRNMTGTIEDWLLRYRSSTDDLWFDGVSLAPWILAVGKDYAELGEEWTCSGAGRDSMTVPESKTLRRSGFDVAALRALGVQFSEYGRVQPYVVTCSATAKLLHFNGGMRPWLVDRFNALPPPCLAPQVLAAEEWKWMRRVKVYCEESAFIACQEIWWKHISEEAACDLKDFDKEWQEDEDKWTDHQMDDEDGKRAVEREARDKLAFDEQEKLRREEERLHEKRRERFRYHWGADEPLPSWKRRDKKPSKARGARASDEGARQEGSDDGAA